MVCCIPTYSFVRLQLCLSPPPPHTHLAVTVTGDKSPALLVEFAVSLCGQFPLDVQLESCSLLLQHTETLMDRRHGEGLTEWRRLRWDTLGDCYQCL